jgi:hypothetical protein
VQSNVIGMPAEAVSARAGTVKQMNSAERTHTQRMERTRVLASRTIHPLDARFDWGVQRNLRSMAGVRKEQRE